MENLFLQVMTISEREEIDMIKANKTFAKRLVEDLSKVYKIYTETRDDSDYSVLHIGHSASHKYDKPRFYADNKGIRFYARLLGYRNSQNYGTLLHDLFLRNKNSKGFDKRYGDECFVLLRLCNTFSLKSKKWFQHNLLQNFLATLFLLPHSYFLNLCLLVYLSFFPTFLSIIHYISFYSILILILFSLSISSICPSLQFFFLLNLPMSLSF